MVSRLEFYCVSCYSVTVFPEKLAALVKALPDDVFMVFCNTIPSCDWTARFLRSQEIPLTKLHGGFSAVVSYMGPLVTALEMSLVALQNRKDLLKGFQQGESKVLVCTDIASRGIDTSRVSQEVASTLGWG